MKEDIRHHRHLHFPHNHQDFLQIIYNNLKYEGIQE